MYPTKSRCILNIFFSIIHIFNTFSKVFHLEKTLEVNVPLNVDGKKQNLVPSPAGWDTHNGNQPLPGLIKV